MKLERNYRSILKSELEARVAQNPAYSLRAFARHVGVSASQLSEVLAGKKNLSTHRAVEIARSLRFENSKSEYFTTLVQLAHTRSDKRKEDLEKKLNEIEQHQKIRPVDPDVFALMSEWYHSAILELVNVTGVALTSQVAASRLDISRDVAEEAILRLVRLGHLTADGSAFKRSEPQILSASEIPNEAFRKYHKQMLGKAVESVEAQTPREKFIGWETIAFDKDGLPAANAIIEDCFRKLIALANERKMNRDVYQIGIELFRLTKPLEN